jgi:hypothetical protein
MEGNTADSATASSKSSNLKFFCNLQNFFDALAQILLTGHRQIFVLDKQSSSDGNLPNPEKTLENLQAGFLRADPPTVLSEDLQEPTG